jgi:hypothetical protein
MSPKMPVLATVRIPAGKGNAWIRIAFPVGGLSAQDGILRTMRVLGRNSTANDGERAPTPLPMIGQHDDD